jgi:gamma-glutamyltranspeptidase/glutathione hydrolase
VVALIALGILRSLGPQRLGEHGSFTRAHHVIEALRLAFADALHYIADPAQTVVPTAALVSDESARQRAARIDPHHANVSPSPAHVSVSDTVYLSVVDSTGNACSFIQSNYNGFGTGLIPPGCGFTLQNRGANFSLAASHPNALAPRKRPYHTIIPALATRADGSLYASFGVMGGFMQPQGHVQVVLSMVDDGLAPQAALDLPRLFVDPFSGEVVLEQGTPIALAAQLASVGHPVRIADDSEVGRFGRGQIIRVSATDLEGGSDRRADGCVGRG